MIYLIACNKMNYCKIGYSSNPENRLTQLQTSNPFSLELVSTKEGSLDDEKNIHKLFDKYRLSGEWFDYSKEIKEYFEVNEYVYMSEKLLNIFMDLTINQFRIYIYLLMNYTIKGFYNNKEFKKELQNVTTSSIQTIAKDIKVLESKELIYCIDNFYKVHPRYAFRCSLKERERELQLIEDLN